jgi:hypothetical protein
LAHRLVPDRAGAIRGTHDGDGSCLQHVVEWVHVES